MNTFDPIQEQQRRACARRDAGPLRVDTGEFTLRQQLAKGLCEARIAAGYDGSYGSLMEDAAMYVGYFMTTFPTYPKE